jgi:hypothetical protein
MDVGLTGIVGLLPGLEGDCSHAASRSLCEGSPMASTTSGLGKPVLPLSFVSGAAAADEGVRV